MVGPTRWRAGDARLLWPSARVAAATFSALRWASDIKQRSHQRDTEAPRLAALGLIALSYTAGTCCMPGIPRVFSAGGATTSRVGIVAPRHPEFSASVSHPPAVPWWRPR